MDGLISVCTIETRAFSKVESHAHFFPLKILWISKIPQVETGAFLFLEQRSALSAWQVDSACVSARALFSSRGLRFKAATSSNLESALLIAEPLGRHQDLWNPVPGDMMER